MSIIEKIDKCKEKIAVKYKKDKTIFKSRQTLPQNTFKFSSQSFYLAIHLNMCIKIMQKRQTLIKKFVISQKINNKPTKTKKIHIKQCYIV